MKHSVELPEFRISRAALGRRLASTLLLARQAKLSPEEFLSTMSAVFDCCVSEDAVPDSHSSVNSEIYESQRKEVGKSVRRSVAARREARKRREARAAEPVAPEQNIPNKPAATDYGDPWFKMSDLDYILYTIRKLGLYPYGPDPDLDQRLEYY